MTTPGWGWWGLIYHPHPPRTTPGAGSQGRVQLVLKQIFLPSSIHPPPSPGHFGIFWDILGHKFLKLSCRDHGALPMALCRHGPSVAHDVGVTGVVAACGLFMV